MNWSDIYKHRSIWMAFAIILIVWWHNGAQITNRVLQILHRDSHCGVDIFMYASGIGCYFSYEKDTDVVSFMQRRWRKLLPTYWTHLMVWIPYFVRYHGITWRTALGNVLLVESWMRYGVRLNWYVQQIWLFYNLVPFFSSFIKKYNKSKTLFFLLLLSFIISVPFQRKGIYPFFETRLPIFLFGMITANRFHSDTKLTWKAYVLFMIPHICGLILLYELKESGYGYPKDLYREPYVYILFIPCVCLNISLLMNLLLKISGFSILYKLLIKIGNNTFEPLLTHLLIYDIINFLRKHHHIIVTNKIWYLAFLAIVPASIILHYASRVTDLFLCTIVKYIV